MDAGYKERNAQEDGQILSRSEDRSTCVDQVDENQEHQITECLRKR